MQNTGVDIDSSVGAPILVKNTVFGLNKAGHKVSLLSLQGNKVVFIEDVNHLQNKEHLSYGLSGTKLFRLFESGVRRLQKSIHFPYYAVFDSFRFYETCNKVLPGYSICHEYQGLFSIGAALACRRLELPYVLTADADLILEKDVSGESLLGFHRRIASKEAMQVFNLARRIICVSESSKQGFVTTWGVNPAKISVLPNGVDLDLFDKNYDPQSIRSDYDLNDGQIIGFVGGFQPWHGLENLIESFSQVQQRFSTAKLLLIGDGPVRSHVEDKARKLGLDSSIVFTGLVQQSKIPELLSVVDVAVLPYPQLPQELWFSPLKLYEYMAAGKAIIGSKSGQIAEVIRDGYNGILVKPGDISDLSKAIIRLLINEDERKYFGRNARQQAIEKHSLEGYINQLEDIYQDVLGEVLL
jgi:glycosyltransferase involved in cell wall biosynthesis